MAFYTDRIRKVASEIPLWLSGADASLAEDSASCRCDIGAVSDESNTRSIADFGGVWLLRLHRDAVDGRVCSPITRDTTGLLHVLSLVAERNQRINAHCAGLHVRISRTERGTTMENLCVGAFPRSFIKHSHSIPLLCAITTSHASVPDEWNASALVSSLHRGFRHFCASS